MKDDIDSYVHNLPEIYQRIWGHPEYDETSRFCEDRENRLKNIVDILQAKLQRRKLKVLDLGCAQGYFCFSLANLGCDVIGIDFCKENIELCNALQQENKLTCAFKCEKLTKEFIESLEYEKYDIVLCFSVIHHICNQNGFLYARKLFEEIAKKTKIAIVELAVKSEPVYWNKKLPVSYDDWFVNIAFFNELGYFQTHLSDISRPMVVFSNRLFFCNNLFFEFDEWRDKSHEYKHADPSRRYYLANSLLMKLYRGDNEYFRNEIINEIKFLNTNKDLDFIPQVITYEKNKKNILSVYKIKKGELLLDAMKAGERLDYEHIFIDIILQLTALEKKGLYHGDLRAWNICLTSGKAFLIDFGNIHGKKYDSIYDTVINPISIYDAFMALIYDVLTNASYKDVRKYQYHNLSLYFDFSKLNENYINFFKSYLLANNGGMTFFMIKELFEAYVLQKQAVSFSNGEEAKILNLQKERLKKQRGNFVSFYKFWLKAGIRGLFF